MTPRELALLPLWLTSAIGAGVIAAPQLLLLSLLGRADLTHARQANQELADVSRAAPQGDEQDPSGQDHQREVEAP